MARVSKNQQVATLIVRISAFAVTLVPILAFLLPWIMVDGTSYILSGVGLVALLASPMREYLYQVDPLQAAMLTMGPALIALLGITTSYRYYQRRSIFWAPFVMFAIALAIVYMADDLVSAVYEGLVIIIAVAGILILHQIAIRIQVSLRRKRKLRKVYRVLAVATGIGYYRWRER